VASRSSRKRRSGTSRAGRWSSSAPQPNAGKIAFGRTKLHGFDTGFVCYHRGIGELRPEDRGLLFEHYVLNEIHTRLGRVEVQYWRSKGGNELDFVFAPRGRTPTAIECKWSADAFDPANLRAFRRRYPKGRNLLVAADVDREFERRYGELRVRFVGLPGLVRVLGASRARRPPGSAAPRRTDRAAGSAP
jgi:Domain of unknown function (DUF4143)